MVWDKERNKHVPSQDPQMAQLRCSSMLCSCDHLHARLKASADAMGMVFHRFLLLRNLLLDRWLHQFNSSLLIIIIIIIIVLLWLPYFPPDCFGFNSGICFPALCFSAWIGSLASGFQSQRFWWTGPSQSGGRIAPLHLLHRFGHHGHVLLDAPLP